MRIATCHREREEVQIWEEYGVSMETRHHALTSNERPFSLIERCEFTHYVKREFFYVRFLSKHYNTELFVI